MARSFLHPLKMCRSCSKKNQLHDSYFRNPYGNLALYPLLCQTFPGAAPPGPPLGSTLRASAIGDMSTPIPDGTLPNLS